MVDHAIVDVGIALAPETFGASVFIAMGASVVNNYMADHAAVAAKSLVRNRKG